ncbi:oxygenase MpaB family protein [Mycolicibacterium hodleri]|uniref:oxygenase MpaB family protein n=1 Tax=Mycolicibacterium hodleri TaxID=49897 RepID=UPI001F42F1E5|nr:oxygenase MpaB family protein [Mycolicibacterium hodleri]
MSVTDGRSLERRGPSLDEGLLGVGLLLGPANVIMQMARPGVGYGVLESRVESGRVDRHPIKRARTTFTYLAVAGSGSDDQKAAFRRAVNKVHAQVYSTDESPVQYNAFDQDLQMWVAACLYKGAVDSYRTFVGEMDDETADRHYAEGMSLGTTLQVPAGMWPVDRAAFDAYWREQLAKVHIDDTVREYLYPIAVSRVRGVKLPGPLQRWNEDLALLITTGFLPQRFRDEMQLEWDARRQRRFDQLMNVLRTATHLSPRFVRQFPFNVLLKDLDWRIRTGRPLV